VDADKRGAAHWGKLWAQQNARRQQGKPCLLGAVKTSPSETSKKQSKGKPGVQESK